MLWNLCTSSYCVSKCCLEFGSPASSHLYFSIHGKSTTCSFVVCGSNPNVHYKIYNVRSSNAELALLALLNRPTKTKTSHQESSGGKQQKLYTSLIVITDACNFIYVEKVFFWWIKSWPLRRLNYINSKLQKSPWQQKKIVEEAAEQAQMSAKHSELLRSQSWMQTPREQSSHCH